MCGNGLCFIPQSENFDMHRVYYKGLNKSLMSMMQGVQLQLMLFLKRLFDREAR